MNNNMNDKEEGIMDRERAANPLDINGPAFDCEAYLSHLLKRKSLQELLDVEHSMVQEVRQLDSEMQTLVYENYNKFITATDTIRNMKTDFSCMEDQMEQLAASMSTISGLSSQVCTALAGRKDNVHKVARASRTLKNLEFIFELPKNLQSFIERREFGLAVESYLRVQSSLQQYKDMPSFKGILDECSVLVDELKQSLTDQFASDSSSPKQSANALALLTSLGVDSSKLAEQFLQSADKKLINELNGLRDEVKLKECVGGGREVESVSDLPMDILEFIDSPSSNFLTNLGLVVTSYSDMFTNKSPKQSPTNVKSLSSKEVNEFISRHMDQLFEIVQQRFLLEDEPSESGILVRALDRFYRRLQATSKLLSEVSLSASTANLLRTVFSHHISVARNGLVQQLQLLLKETRQQLAAGQKSMLAPPPSNLESQQVLSELLSRLEQSTLHALKTSLANLLQFTAYDVTFATKLDFMLEFGCSVRQDVIVSFFLHVIELGNDLCEGKGDKAYVNATLLLVFSRFCKNLQTSTAGYVLDLCEQQFRLILGEDGERPGLRSALSRLTTSTELCDKLGNMAHNLIDHYVQMEGYSLSQLLVKSVETRDWLGCVEPRNVRAAMKRVVEDLTVIDTRLAQLLEEGTRKDRSSDSSRRTVGASIPSRLGAKASTPQLADSALTSTLGKLWTERIDYFSSVQFTKVSVMTGLIKICLKTLMESVRLRTFGRYGLQQVQVDCHYLQLYLWRFVSDEHVVHCLLDEVVSSAVHRCIDPQLMQPQLVDIVCQRG